MDISIFDKLIDKISDNNIKIVLLGESAHGIYEQNYTRIELVKRLHKELDFNKIFIESIIDQNKKINSSDSLIFLKNTLHPVYHTTEMLDFIQYAQKQNLKIDGFELDGDNLVKYKEMKAKSINGGKDSRSYRDKKMFENFDSQYRRNQSEKIIIWGHNSHMSKVTSPSSERDKVFGEYLYEVFGDKSFRVGQFTGQGQIEHMPGQKRKIPQLEGSLESYISSNVNGIKVLPTLVEDIYKNEISHSFCSGENTEKIILNDYFDALIFHQVGSAPIRI